jgi:hypothetical protein
MPSLLENQRDILDALRNLQMGACCPDNTSLFGDEIETDLTPGVGDPPATWGDTQEVASWDEWFNLLCAAADRYVDFLIDSANEAQKLINQAALTIAIIAAILALMSGAGILIKISYTSAAGAFNGIVAYLGTQAFSDAAARIDASREHIICAIKDDDLRSIMEQVLGPVLWVFYQYVQWENATNILWEGGVPGGDQLAPVTGIACPDCENLPPIGADTIWTDLLGQTPNVIGADCNHVRFDVWYYGSSSTSPPSRTPNLPVNRRVTNGSRCDGSGTWPASDSGSGVLVNSTATSQNFEAENGKTYRVDVKAWRNTSTSVGMRMRVVRQNNTVLQDFSWPAPSTSGVPIEDTVQFTADGSGTWALQFDNGTSIINVYLCRALLTEV